MAILENNLKCMNCGHEFQLENYSIDELGYCTTCPECDGSFDIDLDEMLVANNTKVKTSVGEIGIIWGNDAEDTEEFKNINYCFIADQFIPNEVWSNDMEWLLRKDFKIMEA
ncbi:MAG TPA: hypothetical protein VIM42_08445 [Clostridium sp.]